jgi:hypothetical protein
MQRWKKYYRLTDRAWVPVPWVPNSLCLAQRAADEIRSTWLLPAVVLQWNHFILRIINIAVHARIAAHGHVRKHVTFEVSITFKACPRKTLYPVASHRIIGQIFMLINVLLIIVFFTEAPHDVFKKYIHQPSHFE